METYPRAVSSIERTVTLDPNHKAAHHALALAYLGQQELGKARDAAREALKIDANYQPACSLLEAIDPQFYASTNSLSLRNAGHYTISIGTPRRSATRCKIETGDAL